MVSTSSSVSTSGCPKTETSNVYQYQSELHEVLVRLSVSDCLVIDQAGGVWAILFEQFASEHAVFGFS